MKKQPEVTAATRQKLMDAFWTIYVKKDIEKITISEITKTAGYNRGTFYEYFSDIYDILEKIEEDLFTTVKNHMEEFLQDGLPKDLETFSMNCSTIFKQYDDKLFALLGPSGDPKFGIKLKETFLSTFAKYSGLSGQIKNINYVLTFAYSALVGLMTQWYENRKDLSDEEFLLMFQTLVSSGFQGYSNISVFK